MSETNNNILEWFQLDWDLTNQEKTLLQDLLYKSNAENVESWNIEYEEYKNPAEVRNKIRELLVDKNWNRIIDQLLEFWKDMDEKELKDAIKDLFWLDEIWENSKMNEKVALWQLYLKFELDNEKLETTRTKSGVDWFFEDRTLRATINFLNNYSFRNWEIKDDIDSIMEDISNTNSWKDYSSDRWELKFDMNIDESVYWRTTWNVYSWWNVTRVIITNQENQDKVLRIHPLWFGFPLEEWLRIANFINKVKFDILNDPDKQWAFYWNTDKIRNGSQNYLDLDDFGEKFPSLKDKTKMRNFIFYLNWLDFSIIKKLEEKNQKKSNTQLDWINSVIEDKFGKDVKLSNVRTEKKDNVIQKIEWDIVSDWQKTSITIDTSYPNNKKLKIDWLDIEYTNYVEWLEMAIIVNKVKHQISQDPYYQWRFFFAERWWKFYLRNDGFQRNWSIVKLEKVEDKEIFIKYINNLVIKLNN